MTMMTRKSSILSGIFVLLLLCHFRVDCIKIFSTKMTDWEFVFDGVVGFLTSPMWNIPIVSFIEKHCIGKYVKYVNVLYANMVCSRGLKIEIEP